MVPLMSTTQFSMRIDNTTKQKLIDYSAAVKRSQSQIAARAIDEYLERHQAQMSAIREAQEAVASGLIVSQDATESWLKSWVEGSPITKPEPIKK